MVPPVLSTGVRETHKEKINNCLEKQRVYSRDTAA